MKAAQNQLNAKQNNEFKSLMKLLEAKDYKKGLKNSEKLLEQVPDNQEVVSLKAIFMYYNDEPEAGLALAYQAVLKNLTSDFCWHIYGLIQKEEKNYIQAVKCFIQAINKGEENLQLIRDTANLSLHIRDFEGNSQLRDKLLKSKSGMVVNWVGFILSQHLIGNYQGAFNAIKSTEDIIKKDIQNPISKVEINEFKLYQIQLAIEAKDLMKAKKYLQEFKNDISDLLSYYELQYQIYIKLGQKQDAVKSVKELLKLQPQNWKYYQMLQMADPQVDLSIYDNNLVQGRLLAEKKGEAFQNSFQQFIDPFFQKSLPSLFKEIKHLYLDSDKIEFMQKAYETYLQKTPQEQLWALMLLSQHYYQIKDYNHSLQYINQAIQNNDQLHELYLIKAKVLSKLQQFQEAYESADQARQLDLADRYLNNQTIKYALKANMIYKSQDLLNLFLKEGSNPYELQMIWFELHTGKTLLRLNYLGPALQQFYLIFTHFQEMYNDQLDFYQYSIRKYTLRSLLQMIEAMDKRHDQKYFIQSAGLMIEGLQKLKQRIQEKSKIEQKKLNPKEKKMLAKQLQKEQDEKALRDQFSIEGHIFSREIQKKYDLSGDQFLAKFKTVDDVVKMQNRFAQILIHTNFDKKEVNFQAFKQLVSLYINQQRPLLCAKLLLKLRNNQTDQNRIVNHKYQLMLIQYLNKYQGTLLPYIQEFQQDLIQFDSQFWNSVQLTSQLDQTIHRHCQKIILEQPFEESLISDDLQFLQEYPQAKTTHPYFMNDPNLEWQNIQIKLYLEKQQTQPL